MCVAEVQYYMLLRVADTVRPAAVVSFYGPPDKHLCMKLHQSTYWTAQHLRDKGIRVVDIECITSVVMMAPDTQYASWCKDGTELDRWYMMEKPGIKIGHMAGEYEFMSEE